MIRVLALLVASWIAFASASASDLTVYDPPREIYFRPGEPMLALIGKPSTPEGALMTLEACWVMSRRDYCRQIGLPDEKFVSRPMSIESLGQGDKEYIVATRLYSIRRVRALDIVRMATRRWWLGDGYVEFHGRTGFCREEPQGLACNWNEEATGWDVWYYFRKRERMWQVAGIHDPATQLTCMETPREDPESIECSEKLRIYGEFEPLPPPE